MGGFTGWSEILPTLQDLGEVCRLPQPLFPSVLRGRGTQERGIHCQQLSIYLPLQAKPSQPSLSPFLQSTARVRDNNKSSSVGRGVLLHAPECVFRKTPLSSLGGQELRLAAAPSTPRRRL